MMNKDLTVKRGILLLILIIIGSLGRFLLVDYNLQPFPNFELIMVVTFIGAMLLIPSISWFIPLICMVISDLLIGNPIFIGSDMNRIVLFTYSGFAIMALINILNRKNIDGWIKKLGVKEFAIVGGIGVGLSLIYDVWTNIGWWYLLYPHTLGYLRAVFAAGLPFMIYHAVSGALTFILIGLPAVYLYKNKVGFVELKRFAIPRKALVVAVTLVICIVSFTGTTARVPERSEMWPENPDSSSVKITLKGDDWEITDFYIVNMEKNNAFVVLKDVCRRNNLKFNYTYYESFDSSLVDSIGPDINGDGGKYWQFWVNEELPMVGADKFILKNGDSILWDYEILTF